MTEQHSYICRPSLVPYVYQSVPQRLAQLAQSDPDREAFVYYSMEKTRMAITRMQLLNESTSIAKQLVSMGLPKGATVAFCMGNSLELLKLTIAVTLAGSVSSFLTRRLKDGSDLVEMMNFLECRMLILDAEEGDDNWAVLQNIWPFADKNCSTVPTLKHIICNSHNVSGAKFTTDTLLNVERLVNLKISDDIQLPNIFPEDTLAYFCTSGSTGKPKVVTYNHFGVINWTRAFNEEVNITDRTSYFCDRTFSWVVGYPRTYFTEGTKRVFVDTRMALAGADTAFLCDIIRQEACDVVYIPGYLAADLLQNTKLASTLKDTVRTVIMGGERLSKPIVAKLHTLLGARISNLYGTTEAGGVSVFTSDDIDDYEDGIIGLPLPGVEAKIVDESGGIVPAGVQGDLHVRCSWRCTGYKKMSDMFHDAIDDGSWFHTNDMARLRADGNLVIEGRRQEMISIASLKFFPWLVEETLRKCPGLVNAFAVPVPDPRLENTICACVLPKPEVTVSDVENFCNDMFLDESTAMAVSLKPSYYIILRNVPLTPSGKIDRKAIARFARNMLNL